MPSDDFMITQETAPFAEPRRGIRPASTRNASPTRSLLDDYAYNQKTGNFDRRPPAPDPQVAEDAQLKSLAEMTLVDFPQQVQEANIHLLTGDIDAAKKLFSGIDDFVKSNKELVVNTLQYGGMKLAARQVSQALRPYATGEYKKPFLELLNPDLNPQHPQHIAAAKGYGPEQTAAFIEARKGGPEAMNFYKELTTPSSSVPSSAQRQAREGGQVSGGGGAPPPVNMEGVFKYAKEVKGTIQANLDEETLAAFGPDLPTFIRAAYDAGDEHADNALVKRAMDGVRGRDDLSPRDKVNALFAHVQVANDALNISAEATGQTSRASRAESIKLLPEVAQFFPDGDIGKEPLALGAIFTHIAQQRMEGVASGAGVIYKGEDLKRLARIEAAKVLGVELSGADAKVYAGYQALDLMGKSIQILASPTQRGAQQAIELGINPSGKQGDSPEVVPKNSMLWHTAIQNINVKAKAEVFNGADPLDALLKHSKDLSTALQISGMGEINQKQADAQARLMLAYLHENRGGNLTTLLDDAIASDPALRALEKAQRKHMLEEDAKNGDPPRGIDATRIRMKERNAAPHDVGVFEALAGAGRDTSPSEIATIVGRKALEYVKAFSNQGSNAYEILASATKTELQDPKTKARAVAAMLEDTQRLGRGLATRLPPGMLEELAPQIVDDLVERLDLRLPSGDSTLSYRDAIDEYENTDAKRVSAIGAHVKDLGELDSWTPPTWTVKSGPMSIETPSSAAMKLALTLQKSIMMDMAGDDKAFLRRARVTPTEAVFFGSGGLDNPVEAALRISPLAPYTVGAMASFNAVERLMTGVFSPKGIRALSYAARFGAAVVDDLPAPKPAPQRGPKDGPPDVAGLGVYGPGSVQPQLAGQAIQRSGGALFGGQGPQGPRAHDAQGRNVERPMWHLRVARKYPDFNVADAYDSHTILTRKLVKERQPAEIDRLLSHGLPQMVREEGLPHAVTLRIQMDVAKAQERGGMMDYNSILVYAGREVERIAKDVAGRKATDKMESAVELRRRMNALELQGGMGGSDQTASEGGQ